MTDPDRLDWLRHGLGALPRPEPTAECLDDDTVSAFAEASLDPPARATVLSHLAGCSRCRAAVASVARALGDPAVAREVAAIEAPWQRRLFRIALPAAAAAILLLLVLPPQVGDRAPPPQPPHRAPTITAATAPVPMSPVGTVAQAAMLQWSAVAGADRYRVTLFDAGGRVLYEAQLADTVAVLPDSVALSPQQRYLWKVEARVGFDRWSASDLIEFSIGGGGGVPQ